MERTRAWIRRRVSAHLELDGGWHCHCHILPVLDDGPRALDDAVAMVRVAARNGTRAIVATPHHIVGLYPTQPAEIYDRLTALRRRCGEEGLSVALLPGQEIALCPDLPARLAARELLTLGDRGRAVLIELPPRDPPPFWRHTFSAPRVRGITPIIAHAERTVLVSQSELAGEMVTAGAGFQVNTAALVHRDAARGVLDGWLRQGWVACLGTDAHDPRRRPPIITLPPVPPGWRDLCLQPPTFLHPDSPVSA